MAENWSPGPWSVVVEPASVSIDETSYSHQVVIGKHTHTVAITTHQNYDAVHETPLWNGCSRFVGVGRRDPDLTPHPDARLIAAAPELYDVLKAITDCYGVGFSPEKFCEHVREFMEQGRAALAKARGETAT